MGLAKKIIAGVVTASLVSVGTVTGLNYIKKQNVKTVNVCSVGSLANTYYSADDTYLEGMVSANVSQNITLDKDMIVDQVFVHQGDQVHIGDQLVSFDTTLVEMRLNIAKLKLQKLENDLNTVLNRLERVKAGGSISATDLSTSGSSDTLTDTYDDDDTDDGDDGDDYASLGTGRGQNFLAAATLPVMLLADELFTGEASGDDFSGIEDTDLEEDEDEEADADSASSQSSGLFSYYAEPEETESEFSSGDSQASQEESFTSGGGGGYYPWTLPAADEDGNLPGVLFEEGIDLAMETGIGDGEEPFYQKIDWDTMPFTGSGTEEDPYVYLCSSAKGKVEVTGGFLNLMAGYNADGGNILHDGGYWYQLEFHKNDTISDYEDRRQSCTGYYLINGSLLANPVDQFLTTDFTMEDALMYVLDEDDPGDDGDDDGSILDLPGGTGSTTTTSTTSRAEVIKSLQNQASSLGLDLQEAEINISKLEKLASRKIVLSKIDGSVAKINSSKESGAYMTIKSSEGYYVRGTVSELLLDDMFEADGTGAMLKCQDWSAGITFEAQVIDVSEYPVNSNGFMGDGNPNVSYYTYTASIQDKSAKVNDQDYLMVTMLKDADASKGIVLEKAFVRSENGNYYVYRDEGGTLKKHYVSVKANVDGGYSVLIGGGLKKSDLIAFPYGSDVVEGAKTKEVDSDMIYGYE